jgi:rubredoxin
MADTWQCDTCSIYFPSTKNRIRLERKICNGTNKYEYIPSQDTCTDCELNYKKWLKKHRRNNVKSVKGDEV